MRMIKKILNTIFDYPILNAVKETDEDYWDEYFRGSDILETEVPDFIEPKSECKVYHFGNYR